MSATRAYDTVVFYLRGPSARRNFPDLILQDMNHQLLDLSLSSIRRRAIEVGARVDAAAHHAAQRQSKPISDKPDLNQFLDPESSDEA